jgi:hypothetical protein
MKSIKRSCSPVNESSFYRPAENRLLAPSLRSLMKNVGFTLFLHIQALLLEPQLCNDLVDLTHIAIALWEHFSR